MSPHKLLQRQLKKIGASSETPPPIHIWTALMDLISKTYESNEQDRYLIERSLSLSSIEMQEKMENLHESQLVQEAILNSALDCIVTVDQSFQIIEINSSAE